MWEVRSHGESPMESELHQVTVYLNEASKLFAAGQLESACLQLEQASSVLDELIRTHTTPVITIPLKKAEPVQAPRAMAMTA
jgi:hypothetical protein